VIKRGYIIFVSTLLLAQACNRNNNIKKREIYPVSADTTVNAADTALVFHVDTLYLKDKKFCGTVYALYPNLDTAFKGHYLNGLEDGLHIKWHPNKQLAESRNYKQGKKIGKHIGYWEKGNLKFEYHFINGTRAVSGIKNFITRMGMKKEVKKCGGKTVQLELIMLLKMEEDMA